MRIQGVGNVYPSGYNNKDKKKQEDKEKDKEKVGKNKKSTVKEESPSFKDILIMKGR